MGIVDEGCGECMCVVVVVFGRPAGFGGGIRRWV